MNLPDRIRIALEAIQRAPADETQLQDWMEDCFNRAGIIFEREAKCEGGIVDFAIKDGDTWAACEVKVKGSSLAVHRQLEKYLWDQRFKSGIIVATKPMAEQLPTLAGKPVSHIKLWNQFI